MKTGFIVATPAVSTAPAACTRTLDPPTPEEQAREMYGSIVSGANTLLRSDRLGYLATDGEVERIRTTCEGDSYAIGIGVGSHVSGFSVENTELAPLRERRGVSLAVETASWPSYDIHVYGGWLEHSFSPLKPPRSNASIIRMGASRKPSSMPTASPRARTRVRPTARHAVKAW